MFLPSVMLSLCLSASVILVRLSSTSALNVALAKLMVVRVCPAERDQTSVIPARDRTLRP